MEGPLHACVFVQPFSAALFFVLRRNGIVPDL
jgi:hypothetical protein